MRISTKWLADYVDLAGLLGQDGDATELARRLTAVGLEVEAVERTGGNLAGVVVARILSSEKHPDAEKLSVVMVDAGRAPGFGADAPQDAGGKPTGFGADAPQDAGGKPTGFGADAPQDAGGKPTGFGADAPQDAGGRPLQIVCGARNYAVGDLVPLATVGTVLPGGTRIEKAKLRGVPSAGMLCSARELGLSADASGLLILEPGLVPGTPIAKALDLEDVLLEVNVTPNRPDALSHLGIAREVAALLGKKVRLPAAGLKEAGPAASEAVTVRIEAPERCARYAARVIEGVTLGPSPRWLARRLEACGVRSISNVVDATNFVLLELGHPLHAFDLDKVAGREIVVRTARSGEKLTTLDGKERALDPEDLLIADRDRGSALAGVMGGADSEISAGTTRVLLESAWFAPGGIRRTSRRHGLKSEASYRFERGADPGMVLRAADRCAALIAELAGGKVRPGVVDAHPRPVPVPEVRLRWSRPAELLGMDVPRDEVRRILGALGFEAVTEDGEGTTLRVPTWRADVSIEEDLVEELVRARGYDAIPETLPSIARTTPAEPVEAQVLSRVREALEARGFAEAVNFSFVAERDLLPFEAPVETGDGSGRATGIRLLNPISADLAVMRTGVVPSLLKNAALNRSRRVEDLRLYEIARAYRPAVPGAPGDAPAREDLHVAGLLTGRRSPPGWTSGADPVDFYDAKAAVAALLAAVGIPTPVFAAPAHGWLHPRTSAVVSAGGVVLGVVGELHPRVAAAFDLPRGVLAFELVADGIVSASALVPRYGPIPRFPAVLRDLAVVVGDAVQAEALLAAVREEPLVEDATLFDVYRGPPIPEGKKNLALSIRYRAADRTLTDPEADAAHARIVARLTAAFGAGLRA